MAYFYIEIEDGPPISFQVVCNFMGPIVLCHQPVVDYGLVKVNSQQDFEIEIENTSPVMAEVLIKNSLNHKLNFSNMVSAEHSKMQHVQSTASLIYDKPLKTPKGNQITMDRYTMVLKPYEKQSILATLQTMCPERVGENFEVLVRDGAASYF